MMYGGMMGWGLLWLFLVVLGVAALIGILLVARGGKPSTSPPEQESSKRRTSGTPDAPDRAEEIARERFARGEISREQYEEVRRILHE